MSNFLYIPDINPSRFYDVDPLLVPQYLSRHFDDFSFANQIKSWEQPSRYFQKWQTSDIVRYQFTSNFDPILVTLVDKYDIARVSLNATQIRANKYMAGYYVYEVEISLATVPAGCYFVKIDAGTGAKILISEPISVAVEWKNSLYVEYQNSRYHGDVIFETGIKFNFRVEGRIGRLFPGSKDVVYEDQKANPYTLSSTGFKSFDISYGGGKGLPDWVIDKLNLIWTCNSVTHDGKSFAKFEDTKFDLKDQDNYPMRGVRMRVREGINRGSKIFSADVDTNKKLMVVFQIDDSKIFGDLLDPGSNVVAVEGIE